MAGTKQIRAHESASKERRSLSYKKPSPFPLIRGFASKVLVASKVGTLPQKYSIGGIGMSRLTKEPHEKAGKPAHPKKPLPVKQAPAKMPVPSQV
jgi:hypothetical protein